MIQLYKAENNNFEMNGDWVLNPISCLFIPKINDQWVLEIENPIDESIDDFNLGAVISVTTPYGNNQLFRINDRDKNDDSVIATAYPIFLDSKNDCFIWDTRPTNVNGQQALNMMLSSNSKYKASSNIDKINTAYYIRKNFIEALNADDENSFINRWGGEIIYNNYNIIVNDKIGTDSGLRVEFGFNLLGVSEKINDDNLITRIIPVAYNGYTLLNEETVDSDNIDKYPKIYIKQIEYNNIKLKEDAQTDDESNGTIICNSLEELYAELRKQAKLEYTENFVDIPQISYEADMIDLSKTDLYKDYKDLLKVNLGDTVNIKNRRLQIETKSRVISYEYNCITNSIDALVLGEFTTNYFDNVSSIDNSISKVIDQSNNTLMANKISGVINLLNASLRAQKDIAQKQDVRAILFEDLDSDSPNFGALCIGTQGIQISKARNETDDDWVWGTAINFESIIADYVITGILADKLGNNYWNLDTGELVTRYMKAQDATITGTLNGGNINGGNINGSNINTDKDINIGRNINLTGNANSIFAVLMAGRTVLRFIGGSMPTTSVDGQYVQLLADNHILIDAPSISSSVPIFVGSDAKLKENIKDINISNLIDNLSVKRFDYKNGSKNVIGVIAQDLEKSEFSKYIVKTNKEGYKAVDYTALSLACIQKVQKLEKIIKDMEGKNDKTNN